MTAFRLAAPVADAFAPGAIPVAASIGILAGLLTLCGLLALVLLRVIWLQRRRLEQAGQRLREQAREIEERREGERRALATAQNLREIGAHMPVVVFAMRRGSDHLHRLDFLAGNLHALFGTDPQETPKPGELMRDLPFLERIHPEDLDKLRQHLRHGLQHTQAMALDFRTYGAEGLRWLHLVMASHRRDDGDVRWLGYIIDTTDLNAHNQALLAARDAAERASRAKADFLATMSHEIRTPMNGVIGMLELLGRTSLDADQRELLGAVEDSASVLLQILNDVLDFSKLEAGNLRLDPVPFDPRVLIDNVVGLAAGTLHRKGLDVAVAMDATLAGRLLGDDVRLRQILLNLLGNAGKFTERGGIVVALRVHGDDGYHQRLRLSVSDTGIGIPADRQAGLFAPFVQAEPWTARRHGGTGLGLAICRHLVQLMDGHIELASEAGAGTTVTVDVRLPVVQRETDRPAGLTGLHAVVRLGSSWLAAALGAHLVALGLSVETVPPTQPLRRGIAANLLFIDADDRESAAQVAARAIAVDATPGAPALPCEDGERIVLGARPLKWQAVTRACALALEPPGRGATPAGTPAPAHAPPATGPAAAQPSAAHILVAEDHPVNQALARRQLALLGWPCDVVGNGRAALDALRRADYALLMTDCQMPEMDGYELAAAWRRHEAAERRATRLPIIAMTAHALGNEIARCREAGMDDYLSKPVQLKALEEKLLAWLPHRVAPAETPRPPAGAQAVAHGDMLRLLLETSRTDLDAIGQAVARDDVATATQRLHRLLGALQIFVHGPDTERALRLLDRLHGPHAHDALQELPACLADLRRALDRLEHPSAAPVG
jgi:signal transduction histidine kinase/DNA-binding response OmpR family regulator